MLDTLKHADLDHGAFCHSSDFNIKCSKDMSTINFIDKSQSTFHHHHDWIIFINVVYGVGQSAMTWK